MAQRLTQQRQIYYGVESTEGTEVLGTDTEALLVSNLVLSPDQAFLSRSFVGAFGSRKGRLGHQPDPTISFTCEMKGSGANITPEIDELLKSIFGTRTAGADNAEVVGASSTATVINIADTSGFSAGAAVAVETGTASGKYEVGWISSISTNVSITLTDALSFTPTTGVNVKPSLTFAPATGPHQSLSFQIWLDATNRISFRGCKGTVKLDAPAPGTPGALTFTFKAMSWAHASGTRPPSPSYDATTPPVPYKFKLDATATDIKNISWDFGQTIAKKMSQNSTTGTFAQLVTDRRVGGSLQAYDIDETQFTGWNAGTEFALAQQFGDTLFNIVAWQARKAQRSKVTYGDDAGLTTDQIDFNANITSGNDEIRLAYL